MRRSLRVSTPSSFADCLMLMPYRNSRGFHVVIRIGGVAAAMGLGVGMGVRLTSGVRLRAFGRVGLKMLSQGIKSAYSVAKGIRTVYAVHSVKNPVQGLHLALYIARTLAKGASKGVLVKANTGTFKMVSKGLKASEGALNLLSYSTNLHATGWDTLVIGYKLFKSAFNVVEGIDMVAKMQLEESGLLVGVEKGIKVGLDNVGVVVKAFALSKQMQGVLVRRANISKEAFNNLLEVFKDSPFLHGRRKKLLSLLPSEKHQTFCLQSDFRYPEFGFLQDRSMISMLASSFQMEPSGCLECLFCLSLPLNVLNISYSNSKLPSLTGSVVPRHDFQLSQKYKLR